MLRMITFASSFLNSLSAYTGFWDLVPMMAIIMSA
jgi:hypothetical protein